MSDAEKIAAFDSIALAMTNQWHDGKWSWWCPSPCGGSMFDAREEAVVDFIEWAKRINKRRKK